MHLPRGTFHSIKKKVSLKLLLTEILQSQFSGIVVISTKNGGITLVLRQGQAILVEYAHLAGITAFDELHTIDDLPVDAELSTLTDIQIGLAVEYNRAYAVKSTPGTVVFFVKKSQTFPAVENHRISVEKADGQNLGSVTKNVQVPPSPPAIDSPHVLVEGDLNALDTMDLEKMAGKIRVNAKNIARNLDLDHLVADEYQNRVG